MRGDVIIRSAPSVLKACLGYKTPLRVTHCITYRCNLDCKYCRRHAGGDGELTTEEVKSLMESFRKSGCLLWSFNGGEPLMREDLGELIKHGKRLGMHLSLATNGTMIPDRIGDVRNADLVSISIDGPKRVQDEYRCKSFDRVMRGLDALAKEDVDLVFTTVVGRHNIKSIDYVLELAEEYDARVFFQPIRVQKEDQEGKSRKYFPARKEMQDAMDRIMDEKNRGKPVASSTEYLRLIKKCWPHEMPAVGCWAGKLFYFINPGGHVTACCDTLAYAGRDQACNAAENGPKACQNVPDYDCKTCYSAIPLEANIMMDSLMKNPLSLISQTLPRLLWE